MESSQEFDIAVIGGGPAGMMAAITGANNGARVILIEKNGVLGKKLRITGGGRCNITNAIFDYRILAKRYGEKGSSLLSPLARFGPQDTIKFFEEAGLTTKTEAEGRVFPTNNSALDVTNTLITLLRESGVAVHTNTMVKNINIEDEHIRSINTSKGLVRTKCVILATGGTARPETGSTGDGFHWLKNLGHTVHRPDSALVPVVIEDTWVKKLQGLSISDIKLSIFQNNKLQLAQMGKILFTHFGISGPLTLMMSRAIGESMSEYDTTLEIDLFPHLDQSTLDKNLIEYFKTVQNKEWKNALKGFLPARLSPIIAELSGIPLDRFVNKISRPERLLVVRLLKHLTLKPVRLLGPEKAISSSGGVDISEVDFKTMRSKKVQNLYLVGDVLDFNRPSGGFSLQICWSTGFVAGAHAREYTKKYHA